MTAWTRLLTLVTKLLDNKRDGFNFSTGLDLGLAIALRHPEWAVAFRQSVKRHHHPKLAQGKTDFAVDYIVEAVPLEAVTEALDGHAT